MEKPKPWDATLPPPELNVPAGFCSPNEELVKLPNVLAPLFPNRLEVSGENRVRGLFLRRDANQQSLLHCNMQEAWP